MADHGAREHATWSASATERNWNCSGALAMLSKVTTPERENKAAAWGTACHVIAENALRSGKSAYKAIGETIKTKEHEFEVDEEMAETAEAYVDYIRPQINYPNIASFEQRFSLESLKPPFDAGGICDTTIYKPTEGELEIVDLKGGRGVRVEVDGNPQLRTYALGGMIANPGLKIRRIRVTIVQPRMEHKAGRIRSEVFHPADLIDWTTDLLTQMKLAQQAEYELDQIPFAAWWTKWLKPGDHCKFCRAAGICPAIEQRATNLVGLMFDDLDQPMISKNNAPDVMSVQQIEKMLDSADLVTEWLNAVRAHAHNLAESGVKFENYQLVEKIGHRKWKDDAVTVKKLAAHVPRTDLYNMKLKSPAQIEKLLGATKLKQVEEFNELFEKPVTGTNLVRVTKTTRKAVEPIVNQFDVLG